jgi:hypothetical protein
MLLRELQPGRRTRGETAGLNVLVLWPGIGVGLARILSDLGQIQTLGVLIEEIRPAENG